MQNRNMYHDHQHRSRHDHHHRRHHDLQHKSHHDLQHRSHHELQHRSHHNLQDKNHSCVKGNIKVGNFFSVMKSKYPQFQKSINQLTQFNKYLAHRLESRVFLLKCRKSNIFPKFIDNMFNKLHHYNPFSSKITSKVLALKKSLLNSSIAETISIINSLENDINAIRTNISHHIDPSELDSLDSYLSHVKKSQRNFHKNILFKKFHKLKKNISKYPTTNSDWLHNTTDTQLPSAVEKILSLGPNFATPNTNPISSIPSLIVDLEDIYNRALNSDDDKEAMRTKNINIITNHLQKPERTPNPPLPNEFFQDIKITRSFLQTYDNLLITRADKGNKTVIMEKCDYHTKMSNLLSDTSTYEPKTRDPTPSLTKKFNSHIKSLLDDGLINKNTYYHLISYSSVAPRAYGLPKIHKPDLPIRPIISNINSPATNLSKYLLPPLQKLSHHNTYDIKNSFQLKNLLKDIKIPNNFILASLDAQSLFTNIPIDKTLHIIDEKWNLIEPHTTLPRETYLNSLSLCCNSGYFVYNKKYYTQISGLAMGNNLAPDIANITLNHLLDNILPLFPNDIVFIKKYVDDLFLILNPQKIPEILEAFNSYHTRLKFTIETENNHKLPFLDLLIIKNSDGTISTDWFTKNTYSGRLLHFQSAHPLHQKLNVAKNLISRVFNLSEPSFHEANRTRVESILSNNGFPTHLIQKLLKQFTKPLPHTISSPTPQQPYTYGSIPYIPHLTDNLKKSLHSASPNLRLGMKTTNKLRCVYTQTKDPIPPYERSNVVYQIPCSHPTCSSNYTGHTKNHLKTRLKQHENDIANYNDKSTALSEHCIKFKHQPNFQRTIILDSQTYKNKREISECIHINLDPHSINYKSDKDNISSSYANLFNIIKKSKKVPYTPQPS